MSSVGGKGGVIDGEFVPGQPAELRSLRPVLQTGNLGVHVADGEPPRRGQPTRRRRYLELSEEADASEPTADHLDDGQLFSQCRENGVTPSQQEVHHLAFQLVHSSTTLTFSFFPSRTMVISTASPFLKPPMAVM